MSRRKLLFLAVLVVAVLGGGSFALRPQPASSPPAPDTAVVASASEETPTKPFGTPTTLAIPKLNVETAIESVGLDKTGAMDIPKDPSNVAWYNLGFKPGQAGSAVIAGHLDTARGGRAVFWDLDELAPGDNILIADEAGTKLNFAVNSQTSYPADKFPLKEVFATSGQATLNLITCAGTFAQSAGYTQRLVVTATLTPAE